MSSFYPAITGRTTTQLTTSRLLFQIHHDQSAIQSLQTQLSTGRRIERPSQDPSAAIRALSAQRHLEFKAQVDVNLKAADVILSASESTLAQAQSIITEMRGVAVLATGTTFSEEEAKSYANQVSAAIGKLIDLGNSRFRDQYVFGGNSVLAPPFQYIGDAVRFHGNNEELMTVADYASTIAANVTANDAFGAKSSQVVGSFDLNPRIVSATPLSELNRGEGIRRGAISISNGIEMVTIDLANAHNVSDVIERIEAVQVGTRSLDVTLSNTGLNIAYADGAPGLLRIDEVGAGNMAADLGINNTGTAGLSPVVGSDLDPKMTRSTRLENLLGGTGINLGDAFQIRQGNKTYQISTNGLQTVEDLFNRIHRSGAQVHTSIDPSGRFLKIQSTESGTSLSIGEAGSNLASRLGLRTFDLGTSVSSLNNGQGIFTTDLGPDLVFTPFLLRPRSTSVRWENHLLGRPPR
jgi:flagellar hook-associated protein 3 FlgL